MGSLPGKEYIYVGLDQYRWVANYGHFVSVFFVALLRGNAISGKLPFLNYTEDQFTSYSYEIVMFSVA